MDLRELQQSGRIGRIKVELHSEEGKSKGTIIIPCSLDRTETAILAAAIETVNRVGPCSAKISLERVEDVREEKRKKIISRAVDLLRGWEEEVSPDAQEVTDTVLRESRTAEIVKYGSKKLPAGPAIDESDTIIIVEGRADVLALLRGGIKNAIAVEGTSIPKTIIDLSKKKKTIAFLDGDRGGELILKELSQVTKIDFVARAPTGREVEELTQKEITKALRNKVPATQLIGRPKRKKETPTKKITLPKEKRRTKRPTTKRVKELRRTSIPKAPGAKSPTKQVAITKPVILPKGTMKKAQEIQQTMMAVILDQEYKPLKELHVAEVATNLQEMDSAKALILDGVVTQRLIDISEERGIELIIGARIGNIVKKPVKMRIYTFEDL